MGNRQEHLHDGRLAEIITDADNFYRPEIKAMAQELLDARREALILARALHEQEYSHVSEWVPDEDVVGLILQISNMAAGLRDEIWSLREEIKDLRLSPSRSTVR